MRWPLWQRSGRREPECRQPARMPDHDRAVLHHHHRPENWQWSSLLGGWLEEPTQPLPLSDLPPETDAGRWRAQGGRA
jgi:hypothetical protein